MKTKLLINALLLLSFVSYGQITITATEGEIPVGKFPYTYIKNKGTAFPDTGENVVWDYSHFVPCDNCESITEFQANKDKEFPSSNRIAATLITLLGFPISGTEYYEIDETGDLYRIAEVFKPKTIPLKRITGHPLDKVKVEEHKNINRILEYDFPFEYGKKWTTNSIDTIHFLLNMPSANITNLAVQEINLDTTFQSIIGYGKLKLPYFKHGERQIVTYDALLLKKIITQKIYLEADIDDAQFEELFRLGGVSKYNESTCVSYKFYIRELSLFVLAFSDCSGKGIIQHVRLRTDLDKYTPKTGE